MFDPLIRTPINCDQVTTLTWTLHQLRASRLDRLCSTCTCTCSLQFTVFHSNIRRQGDKLETDGPDSEGRQSKKTPSPRPAPPTVSLPPSLSSPEHRANVDNGEGDSSLLHTTAHVMCTLFCMNMYIDLGGGGGGGG